MRAHDPQRSITTQSQIKCGNLSLKGLCFQQSNLSLNHHHYTPGLRPRGLIMRLSTVPRW